MADDRRAPDEALEVVCIDASTGSRFNLHARPDEP